MKKIFEHSLIYLLLIILIGGSCLKNNDLYQPFTDIKPIADIPLSHLSSDTLTVYSLDVAPSIDASIDTFVAIHLSAKDHVGNVTFQMGLGTNDSAYVAYMAAHPEYTLMPSNLYNYDSSVTISNAGVLNTATFPIRFKTGILDTAGNNVFITNQYVLPIIIKDAGGYGIASNFRMIIMRVLAKNAYDADYNVTGFFFRAGSGSRPIDQVKHLSTASAIGLQGEVGDLGTPFTFEIAPNNTLMNWVSFGFTSSGFMSEDNPSGSDYSDASNQGYLPGDATFNSTIYNNTYDPSTKTFYMHYGYVNGSSTGQEGYTRQIYEKWVRIN